MKRIKKIGLLVICCFTLVILPTSRSQAQIIDIILEAIKAAIKAADIAVEKAQNATIDLQNVQKQVENELSKLKLDDIANWAQQTKDLYQEYFNELKEVKTLITYYQRVTEIINKQKQLVADYKQAYALVQQDKHFSANEIKYIYSVYSGIIDESVKNVDQIANIIQSFATSMTDEERLKIINRSADGIEQQISDLRRFNNQNIQLSLQRARDQEDVNAVRQLYGL
jgi:ATP-dependent 26S proteasome regulatory subunit